jgi:hypothetical protein
VVRENHGENLTAKAKQDVTDRQKGEFFAFKRGIRNAEICTKKGNFQSL